MLQTSSKLTLPCAVVGLSGALILLPGCGKVGQDAAPGVELKPANGRSTQGLAEAVAPAVDERRLASVTNHFEAALRSQQELVQRLLARIDQLEKRDVERSGAVVAVQQRAEGELKAQEAVVGQMEKKLGTLEKQLASVLAGKVLPEIVLAGETPVVARQEGVKSRESGPGDKAGLASGGALGVGDGVGRGAGAGAGVKGELGEAKVKGAPKVSVGPGGFSISSADTNFVFRLRGLVQVDSRSFINDNERLNGNDAFLLRRARPIFEGTVFRDFDFQFVPDFGGSTVQVFDAWMNYRYRPELQLKAGKFKGPVGLEHLHSVSTLGFNERSLVSALIPARNVGVQLGGDVGGGLVSYAAGVFNVTGDGRVAGSSDVGEDKEYAARVFLRPLKNSGISALEGFEFGVGASSGQVSSNANGLPSTTGGTRPGYVTAGQQQFFAYHPVIGTAVADGALWRVIPQFSHVWGPFGLMGEYAISHQGVLNDVTGRSAELEHSAWQLSAQWVLTGENASFSAITPKRPFSHGSGGWGAWQLVGRYGRLDIDPATFPSFSNPDTSAKSATAWSVGLNWWLNRNLRVMTSFSHTSFEGGGRYNPADATTLVPPAAVTYQDENVVFTRLQLGF